MTWNIRFAAGRIPLFYDGWGTRYNMTKSEVERNLATICRKIVEVDPDILLLQEVDVESKRSAYVNELQYILDRTNLGYAVYAPGWRTDFVPSDGIGRINDGNAILSKWPLSHSERIGLPLRTDQSSIERYFWLHRCFIKATLAIPGHPDLEILNLHAESYGKDSTKKKHIDIFKQHLDAIALAGGYFVGGGDFNELPPGSPLWVGFPDDVQNSRFGNDNYVGEEMWMDDIYKTYCAAIPLLTYQANPSSYFTFTGDANGFWCRTIDHIFTNNTFRSGIVLQTTLLPSGQTGLATMPLSDHAPVYAVLEIKQ
jgi:endonuclease/exonuclease/phosphatase family metal-dependent hydrolase